MRNHCMRSYEAADYTHLLGVRRAAVDTALGLLLEDSQTPFFKEWSCKKEGKESSHGGRYM